jgi:hypothetical protein
MSNPQEIERATIAFQKIPLLIDAVNADLIPQAQAQGLPSFVASGRLLRLDRKESWQKPGFYDDPKDIWPEGQCPDATQLQGAALLLWQRLEQAGWAPHMERALFGQLCFEAPLAKNKKPAGDFRGYFFYISIRWTVTFPD